MLHFSSAFPICSRRFSLPSWILVLLIICASFYNVFLVSLHRTGTPWAHSCFFILLKKFMIITRHEVTLVYFRLTNCFHTIFGVSNSKYSIHAILTIQFVFPLFLTSTYMTANTIRSYVRTNLFTNDELQLDEASYSNIEEALRDTLFPTLFSRKEINANFWKILYHSVNCGGLGITDPRLSVDGVYNTSNSDCGGLVGSLLGGINLNYAGHISCIYG